MKWIIWYIIVVVTLYLIIAHAPTKSKVIDRGSKTELGKYEGLKDLWKND